jgi:deazaflavin-dependent oxidoreductase (nitroreductase family)
MTEIPSYFKYLNKMMILAFRLGLGSYISNDQVGHIMVLITTGRKSGHKRLAPVNYAWDGPNAVYCVPAHAKSAWLANLQSDPNGEVWIGDEWWTARAEIVTSPDVWVRAYREVLVHSGFAAGQYLGLDPHTVSDDELRAVGEGIPVVRLLLETRLYGPGGPGDLRWVWPLVVIGILIGWVRQRR